MYPWRPDGQRIRYTRNRNGNRLGFYFRSGQFHFPTSPLNSIRVSLLNFKDAEFFKDFTLVILCGVLCRSELLRITKILRKLEIKCIIGATFGLYGVGFNDFLAHEYAL